MKGRTAAWLAAAVMVLACGCGKKDFEGEIAMRITRPGAATAPAQSATTDLVLETKAGNVRVDMNGAGTQSPGPGPHAIAKAGETKMVLVMDDQKAFMAMNMSSAGAAAAAQDPEGTPKVTKTGTHETIAGRDCEVWKIEHTSGKRTEACIAEGLVYFDFGSMLPNASPAPSAVAAELRQKKLFPLRSVEYDAQGKETSRMVVTRIDAKSLDASRFEIPADYKEMSKPS